MTTTTAVPRVPSRTWYDPVLDATMHTGQKALLACGELLTGTEVGSTLVAADIETPGLDNAFTINCVTFAWDSPRGVQTVILNPRRDPQAHKVAFEMFGHARHLVFHNAPFDIPPLHHAGLLTLADIARIIDTVVLARYAMPEPPPFGQKKDLTSLSVKFLGLDDDKGGLERAFKAAGYKTQQAGFEGMDIASPVYRYGAMADTVATLRLEPIIRAEAVAWSLDHPFVTYGATTEAEAHEKIGIQETVHRSMLRRSALGLAVNREYLDRYAEEVDVERNLAIAELAVHGLEGGTGKGAKLVQYLDDRGELPQPWPRTPTGNLRATKADLDALDHPLANAQRKLAEIEKVMGYLQKVDRQASVTGRCHPQVATLGASATGRMSYGMPELQQFPKAARAVIGDDGQGLTSIDWSQIEPVTMANMARDVEFLEGFENGEDLYDPIMRSCGCDRDTAKVVLLSTMYGSGIVKLAATIGHTEESAAQIRRQMFAAMRRSAKWMSMVQEIAETHGRVITAGGRILPVDNGGSFKAVNYCLSPHTLILRSDLTHVRADTIAVGDRLVAFDEHPQREGDNLRKYHQMRTATVEAVSTVVKPTVLVYTDDGWRTGCSTDHLWLVRPCARRLGHKAPLLRWLRADELEPGDELLSLGTWRTDTSRTAGYLAGLLDGEGHLTRNIEGQRKSCQLGFSQLAGPVLDAYLKGMSEVGLRTHHQVRSANSTSPTDSAVTSGVRTVMQVVGTLRPERFIACSESIYEGRAVTAGLTAPVKVLGVKPIGDTELTSIQTSTRTLVANGYLSHNCVQGSAYDVLAHSIVEMERRGIGQHLQLAMHDELVVDTTVADEVREIMLTPPPFLIRWAERVPVFRTDRADMGNCWQKV